VPSPGTPPSATRRSAPPSARSKSSTVSIMAVCWREPSKRCASGHRGGADA
jgi:hypothetical protein